MYFVFLSVSVWCSLQWEWVRDVFLSGKGEINCLCLSWWSGTFVVRIIV